jgi:hypothetical protein
MLPITYQGAGSKRHGLYYGTKIRIGTRDDNPGDKKICFEKKTTTTIAALHKAMR